MSEMAKKGRSEPAGELSQDIRGLRPEKVFRHPSAKAAPRPSLLGAA